jgi:hyperosmotically inducible protein
MKYRLALIAAALLVAPIVGYSRDDVDMDRSHPKAFVKDSAITSKIKAKLAAEAPRSAAHIHVDTDADGIVWLSGYARSREEADRAVAIARETERVVAVKNEIKIKHDL